MKMSVVSARTRYVVSAALLGTVCALLPTAASATTFNYTAAVGDVTESFSITTSLSGAALDNLTPGTAIPLTGFTFEPTGLQADEAGFAAGGPFGSNSFNVNSGPTVEIGTNAIGQITSWTITEGVFVSWPAFMNENINDFFGTYTLSLTNTGDTRTLIVDNDAGFAPGDASSGPGTFGAEVSATPLPAALPLFAGGLGFVGYLTKRRKRDAKKALIAA